jgi:salicylate hydroxylase
MRSVVVVGGGIGGLTAAIALRQIGCDVLVLERSRAFGEVGAGLQLGPHASRVLRGLGLGPALREIGVQPSSVRFLRWQDDTELCTWPLAEEMESTYGAPYYTIYRPDLVEVLAAQLPADAVRLGAEVATVHAPPDGPPSVRLADGTTVTADLVVGADGTHSVVRAATVGVVPARFSGVSAYRALVPREALTRPDDGIVRNWLGPGRHLVAYPVGQGSGYVNLVCIVPDPYWSEESWTAPGRVEDLRAHFAGWSPLLQELLDAITGPVFRWALYDRQPMKTWSTARTTLLGDAAHPMLPFMAQGAAQAIGDAAALAARLREAPDGSPTAAIAAYERARRPHTARIQLMSWDNNSSFHLPDGPEQRRRDEALAKDDGLRLDRLDWLYGNDAERLATC